MKISCRRFLPGLLAFLSLTAAAVAHPGHDGHELTWDLKAGLGHPFSGWDHIFAMVAVGWWAVQLGGRARWLVPGAFVSLLLLSAAVGTAAMRQSMVEQGIAASLVVFGLVIASRLHLPDTAAAAVVGSFAVFHGLAHGAEIPVHVGALGYRMGFELASAALIGGGMVLGVGAQRIGGYVHRIAGAGTAIAGLVLLCG